jgi:hypothetical protein
MRDQVNGLRKMGIKVGLLCNESTPAEAIEVGLLWGSSCLCGSI